MRNTLGKSIVLIALLLLIPAVHADEAESRAGNAAFMHMQCKTEFTQGVLKVFITVLPSASTLQTNVDKLRADLAELETKAADPKAYTSYVRTTLHPDLRDSKQASLNVSLTTSTTKAQRSAIRDGYMQKRATYITCTTNATQAFAEAKLALYKKKIAGAQEKANTLQAKGVGIAAVNKVIVDANTQIVAPMESELGNASTLDRKKGVLDKYCLYNGCEYGTNFHFAAKLAIETTQGILNLMKTNANAAQAEESFKQAQIHINAAREALAIIGTKAYSESDKDAVWSHIRAAEKDLKDARKVMK